MPRAAFALALALLLAPATPASPGGRRPAHAPQTSFEEQVEQGRQQYLRGDARGAAETLRAAVKQRQDVAEAWYYLGMALAADGDTKEARKSFERALKLRPGDVAARAGLAYALAAGNRFADAQREARLVLEADPRQKDAHFVLGTVALRTNDFEGALREAELALSAEAEYAPALILKTQALVGAALNFRPGERAPAPESRAPRLQAAEEALAALVRLNPQSPQAAEWREQLDAVRAYVGELDFDRPDRTVFRGWEVHQRAVIHAKPEPSFPETARRNGTQGVVRLRLVLAADGTVKHILPVRTLPHGLTEAAVSAARKIRFTPAVKDGRPVSTAVMVEYKFDIY